MPCTCLINNTAYQKSYYIIVSLILLVILFTGTFIVYAKNVNYKDSYKNTYIALDFISTLLMIVLLLDYYNKYSVNLTIVRIIIVSISIFLLYFGMMTIREDETTPDTQNREVVSLNNYDISIYSILVGGIVLFLEITFFVVSLYKNQ